ncbi:12347_t:CDS:2 [Entrophospora sp. SA101]|nr:12347_t:CDS:2 [Entrophospora sp. SA101]
MKFRILLSLSLHQAKVWNMHRYLYHTEGYNALISLYLRCSSLLKLFRMLILNPGSVELVSSCDSQCKFKAHYEVA